VNAIDIDSILAIKRLNHGTLESLERQDLGKAISDFGSLSSAERVRSLLTVLCLNSNFDRQAAVDDIASVLVHYSAIDQDDPIVTGELRAAPAEWGCADILGAGPTPTAFQREFVKTREDELMAHILRAAARLPEDVLKRIAKPELYGIDASAPHVQASDDPDMDGSELGSEFVEL
jgi:hypothetical protein